MSTENLTVSTITWARNRKEEELVYDSLSALSGKNIHVVAVDGGSSEEFLDSLKKFRNISVVKSSKTGLQNQVVESLRKAQTSSKYIFYTEANKSDFFRSHFDGFLSRAMNIVDRDPNTGIVLPSRTKESFSSYPAFQQQSESFLNTVLSEFIERGVGDFSYGPRIIVRDLIPYLDGLSRDVGWGWMTYLLLISKKLGRSIYTVDLDLPCPKDERENTYADKLLRLKQLKNHIEAIEEALNFKP